MNKLIYIQECVAELYAFTEVELSFYREELNFKYVSANRKIDWSYNLIREFEQKWDWGILDSNRAVFDKVTLGLLFPDKVELPICGCYRKDEFCEDAQCGVNSGRLQQSSNLLLKDKSTYYKIDILCGTTLIDEELLLELYKNDSKVIEGMIDSFFAED